MRSENQSYEKFHLPTRMLVHSVAMDQATRMCAYARCYSCMDLPVNEWCDAGAHVYL